MRWHDGDLSLDTKTRLIERIEQALRAQKPQLTDDRLKVDAEALFSAQIKFSTSKQDFFTKLECAINDILFEHKHLKKIKKIIQQNDSLNWKEEIDLGIKLTLINKYLEIVYHPSQRDSNFETVLNNAIDILNKFLTSTHQHEFLERFVYALRINSSALRKNGFHVSYPLSETQFKVVWEKIELDAKRTLTPNFLMTTSSTSSSSASSTSTTSTSSVPQTVPSQLPQKNKLFQPKQTTTSVILGKRSRNEEESLLVPNGLREIKKLLYPCNYGSNTIYWLDVFLEFNEERQAVAFVEAMAEKLDKNTSSKQITVRLRSYRGSLSHVIVAPEVPSNVQGIDGGKFLLNELAKYCDLTNVTHRFYKYDDASPLNDNELPEGLGTASNQAAAVSNTNTIR